MEVRILYLDIDDEITTAAARVRGAEGTRVAIVLPNGSRVATSRINFRLLARDATLNSKRLSIVSGDAATRALAASAGLPIFASVAEYEAALEAERGAKGAQSTEPAENAATPQTPAASWVRPPSRERLSQERPPRERLRRGCCGRDRSAGRREGALGPLGPVEAQAASADRDRRRDDGFVPATRAPWRRDHRSRGRRGGCGDRGRAGAPGSSGGRGRPAALRGRDTQPARRPAWPRGHSRGAGHGGHAPRCRARGAVPRDWFARPARTDGAPTPAGHAAHATRHRAGRPRTRSRRRWRGRLRVPADSHGGHHAP